MQQDQTLTAIAGTRRTFKELVDGTIRVQIDIDPRFKDEFLERFREIDMPVALAPLVADFERREPQPEPDKGGALCKLAGMWCRDEEFRRWLASLHEGEMFTEEDAAEWIRLECDVESRSHLDHDAQAAERFQRSVRLPYMNWLRGSG